MPLSDERIQQLIAVRDKPKTRTGFAPQIGPLRYGETTQHCSNRGCMTMTHYRVQGAPKCEVHALEELNNMLLSAGFKGVATSHSNSPTPCPAGRVVSSSTRARLHVGFALTKFVCIHGISLERECAGCD